MSSYNSAKRTGMRIYSQNVNKQYIYLSDCLEEFRLRYDIIFVQEPGWRTVRHSASMLSKDGTPVKGPPIHPQWIPIIPKKTVPQLDRPRVMAYVHRNLVSLKPKL